MVNSMHKLSRYRRRNMSEHTDARICVDDDLQHFVDSSSWTRFELDAWNSLLQHVHQRGDRDGCCDITLEAGIAE